MKTFVFLGSVSELPEAGIKLTRFGQRAELPDEIAEQIKHRRGLPCIPAEDFDALGFTAEELRKYNLWDKHENASPEFIAKRTQALEILHKLRGGE